MPSDAYEVSLESVNKFYAKGKRALCDLTVKVEPGEFVVLLGPSGSGKSTLLRSIAGIERISSGTITIGGIPASSGSNFHLPPEKRGLAMVFQDYALWPHMRVKENVAFALGRTKLARSLSHLSQSNPKYGQLMRILGLFWPVSTVVESHSCW